MVKGDNHQTYHEHSNNPEAHSNEKLFFMIEREIASKHSKDDDDCIGDCYNYEYYKFPYEENGRAKYYTTREKYAFITPEHFIYENEEVKNIIEKTNDTTNDYYGDSFNIVNTQVTFKQYGEYIITCKYGYFIWFSSKNEEPTKTDTINLNTERLLFNCRQLMYFNKIIYPLRLYQQGMMPFMAETIKFIRVVNGKIEMLPLESKSGTVNYQTINATIDKIYGTISFSKSKINIPVIYSLDNIIRFNDWLNADIYVTNFNESYTITNNTYINNSLKLTYTRDTSWWGGKSGVGAALLELQVIKLDS